MKDVLPHKQLFVLMDANARTGKRGEGGVGSKDNKVLRPYGWDTLNDNGGGGVLIILHAIVIYDH